MNCEVKSMNSEDSIEKTRLGFEAIFETEAFYNRQTQDEKHLELILNCLDITGYERLQTGNRKADIYLLSGIQQPAKLTLS